MFWSINLFKLVQACSHFSKLDQTFPNLFELFQTCLLCSNLFKHFQTCSNMFKYVQTCSNLFKLVETCLNLFKYGQTCLTILTINICLNLQNPLLPSQAMSKLVIACCNWAKQTNTNSNLSNSVSAWTNFLSVSYAVGDLWLTEIPVCRLHHSWDKLEHLTNWDTVDQLWQLWLIVTIVSNCDQEWRLWPLLPIVTILTIS